ncbi:MAG: DoxX family protein, partial [Flavobacteriales bacterium]|nr:DoxX family protein [Flavobacteriales bacterium]
MRYLLLFSRWLVGSLFIVSGLIKANDPLGFSYKLEEYFAETALNLPFMEPWSLALSILVCVGEIVLGFAVLFGGKMRLASWSLLLLTVFFGWLTAYTATCNPADTFITLVNGQEVTRTVTCVTDCGCFGDAMKGSIGRSLTPWESFAKDMVLLVFVIPLFIFQKRIYLNNTRDDLQVLPVALLFVAFFSWIFTWWFPLVFTLLGIMGYLAIKYLYKGAQKEWAIAAWAVLMAFGFAWYTYGHLPIRDYRPFAVGKNIAEGMMSAEELGLEPPKFGYRYTLRNSSSGEEIVVSDREYIDQKWWEKTEWEMLAEKTEQFKVKDGYEPPIHDFYISDGEGNDRTAELLAMDRVLLVISYDIRKADKAAQASINELYTACRKEGVPVIGLSSSPYDFVNEFRHETQSLVEYWTADAIMLKTVVRANPGIVLLKKGTVSGKWHYNDIPDVA